jgi:pimeloyl-ACP methyl ester carboxylesterase
MATKERNDVVVDQDRAVETAQAAYLARCAPGYRTRRVRWSGGTTQVIELGDSTPLVLVHGGLGEASQWGCILSALARRHRVLAVDRPGHGLADPFDYCGVDLLAHARRFLGEFLDAEGLPSVPIVANSMGGLWSVAFALQNPERVPRLVLVGAPAGMKRTMPIQLRLAAMPIVKTVIRSLMKRPTHKSTRRFWQQLLVAHPERLEDHFLDLVAASQARNCSSWFTLIDRVVTARGLKPEFVLGAHWQGLAVATTFVWGERDAFGAPEEAEVLAAKNSRFTVVRIPDAGHVPWLDDPEKVCDAIDRALT